MRFSFGSLAHLESSTKSVLLSLCWSQFALLSFYNSPHNSEWYCLSSYFAFFLQQSAWQSAHFAYYLFQFIWIFPKFICVFEWKEKICEKVELYVSAITPIFLLAYIVEDTILYYTMPWSPITIVVVYFFFFFSFLLVSKDQTSKRVE